MRHGRAALALTATAGFVGVVFNPSGAVSAAATGACKVVAQDIAGSKSGFDFTCTHAIANGSISIAVNRGARGNMSVTQPAGHTLQCMAIGTGGNSSQPSERLDCTGSAAAGMTVRLIARLTMFTSPCDLPTFKGNVTVRFGDGATFGPRALPPYHCSASKHRRRFSQFNSGSTPQGQGYIGQIDPIDGFVRCVSRAPIWIQRRSGSRWITALRTHASASSRPDGGHTFTGLVPASGVYRAFAPTRRFGNQLCPAVASAPSGPGG
jgi:hypothetical protein